jgi:hypothetical protein
MAQSKNNISPSLTWGSSAKLISTANGVSVGAQLAAVNLPEPTVCTLYFQSRVTRDSTPVGTGQVNVFTLNLYQGVGRVTIPRQISFASQPTMQQPIEFTLPWVPLQALQVDISQTVSGIPAITGGTVETETYLVLAPITRIAQSPKEAQMQFGMAMPGEADSLDDDMRDELEAEAPTVAEIMGREMTGEIEPEPEPEPELPPMSAEGSIVSQIIAELTERLGRVPTRAEAKAAVARVQARLSRRGVRSL